VGGKSYGRNVIGLRECVGIAGAFFLQRRFCIVSECPGVDRFGQHKRVSQD
jgi:hypothetical protein